MDSKLRLLCAVDFSEQTDKIIAQAKNLAQKTAVEIYLVFVVKSLDRYEQFNVAQSFREQYEQEIQNNAKAQLAKIKEELADLDVHPVILNGEPARELVNFGAEKGLDMIIICSQGVTSIHNQIFGSVAEKVLKLSSMPVLLVK